MRHISTAVARSLLSLALFVLASLPLHGQVTGGSTLRGRITSAAGQPIAGAMVIRSGIRADTVRSDSAGRYSIGRLALGRHLFVVVHPGFEAVEMEVGFPVDTVFEVDIPLTPSGRGATSGAAVTARLDSVGFTRRWQAVRDGRARGVFFGPEDLASRGEQRVSQLFEGLSDIRVRVTGRFAVVYGDGGRCVMDVWIDGNQARDVYPVGPSGIDEVVQIRHIAAVEVYSRNSQVPTEFRSAMRVSTGRRFDTRTTECGAILIWSR